MVVRREARALHDRVARVSWMRTPFHKRFTTRYCRGLAVPNSSRNCMCRNYYLICIISYCQLNSIFKYSSNNLL